MIFKITLDFTWLYYIVHVDLMSTCKMPCQKRDFAWIRCVCVCMHACVCICVCVCGVCVSVYMSFLVFTFISNHLFITITCCSCPIPWTIPWLSWACHWRWPDWGWDSWQSRHNRQLMHAGCRAAGILCRCLHWWWVCVTTDQHGQLQSHGSEPSAFHFGEHLCSWR